VRTESGEWGAAGAATQAVNQAVLDDVLALASNLRALRIECHNPRHLESYGLDRTGTTLSFSLSGKEGIQRTLILGFRARMDGVFAMIQGQDVVFVLTNSVAELLTRDLSRPVAQDASAQPVKSGASR
jgi:hypothetical protein